MNKRVKLFAASLLAVVSVFAVVASSSANAMTWSGGLHVYNKTNGHMLHQNGNTFKAHQNTNVVFTPEGMGPNAHHFTLIVKDMKTGDMVWGAYRTNVSRWSMEHPTEDGSLGYTFARGNYWVQVDAYQADGVGAGNYYSKLTVK